MVGPRKSQCADFKSEERTKPRILLCFRRAPLIGSSILVRCMNCGGQVAPILSIRVPVPGRIGRGSFIRRSRALRALSRAAADFGALGRHGRVQGRHGPSCNFCPFSLAPEALPNPSAIEWEEALGCLILFFCVPFYDRYKL